MNKLGKEESLTAPLGYKCSIADVAVKSSAGKKNLTQIEVMENVRYFLVHYLSGCTVLTFCILESLGVREITIEVDLHHPVHVLDDRVLHVDLDDHDLCGLPP